MNAASELHIIVPGVCGPLAETSSLQQNDVVTAWVRRLSKAKCQTASASVYDAIVDIFGFDIDTDFPVAMFEMLASDNHDTDVSYMCADPVHLQADMDHAILMSGEDISISDEESAELCDVLDQHFAQDGIRFTFIDRSRWMVSSADEIELSTTPLCDAVGRNINFLLPQGKSATYWKQVLTEAQMLMFSHDINDARESRGQSSINSLWFYGSGRLPDAAACMVDTIVSDEKLFSGIASHVQCKYYQLPTSVSEYTRELLDNDDSVNVLHLQGLDKLTNYTDVSLWSKQLEVVLDDWIYPLISLAKQKKISLYLYPCNGKRYQFTRYDGLRFWRSDKIEQHIACY